MSYSVFINFTGNKIYRQPFSLQHWIVSSTISSSLYLNTNPASLSFFDDMYRSLGASICFTELQEERIKNLVQWDQREITCLNQGCVKSEMEWWTLELTLLLGVETLGIS